MQYAAALHDVGQLDAGEQLEKQNPEPSQVYEPQPFSGSVPEACGLQVPSCPN